MEKAARVVVLLSVAGIAGAVACTTTTSNGPLLDASVEASAGDAGDGGRDGGDEACPLKPDQEKCLICCDDNHPESVDLLNTALITCACTGFGAQQDPTDGGADAGDAGTDAEAGAVAGPCSEECKDTLCAKKPDDKGSACFACLSRALGGACRNMVLANCARLEDCQVHLGCYGTCPEE